MTHTGHTIFDIIKNVMKCNYIEHKGNSPRYCFRDLRGLTFKGRSLHPTQKQNKKNWFRYIFESASLNWTVLGQKHITG